MSRKKVLKDVELTLSDVLKRIRRAKRMPSIEQMRQTARLLSIYRKLLMDARQVQYIPPPSDKELEDLEYMLEHGDPDHYSRISKAEGEEKE